MSNDSRRKRSPAAYFVIYAFIALYLLSATFPFYWMLLTSLREPRQVYNREAMLVPQNLTLQNYIHVITQRGVPTWLENSTIVAVTSSCLATLIGLLGAYSLARLRFRGRQFLLRSVILMYLVPGSLLFIPLFIFFDQVSLLDTRWALILSNLTFQVPFAVWFLLGYFKSIPIELEDAARIDGCDRLGVLLRVVVPVAAPGVAASWIFGFTTAWNEYLYANVLVTRSSLKTIPVALQGFLLGDVWLWGPLMATAVIATMPVLILFMVAQRFFVRGLAAGSVKG